MTSRLPNDALYHQLQQQVEDDGADVQVARIGDCDAPSIIATAVFAGHRYAQELDEQTDAQNPMRYDRVFFED